MGYPYHQAYTRNSVETSTPEGLILMLYDGAITSLMKAEAVFGAEPREESQKHVYKAQDIISELMSSLDFERGGDIAPNLFRVYEYMNFRLVQAVVGRDPAPIAEVAGMIRDLRQAWKEAADTLREKRQVAAPRADAPRIAAL